MELRLRNKGGELNDELSAGNVSQSVPSVLGMPARCRHACAAGAASELPRLPRLSLRCLHLATVNLQLSSCHNVV